MTTISPTTSQISPATERVYHQSNLLGDWKGTWANSSSPVEFKVVNIRGDTAQIEYTHDGHTERGLADVNGATITFGNVTIGTRNGSVAAFEFSVSGAKKTGQGVEDTAKGVGHTAKAGAAEVGQRAKHAAPDAKAVGDNLHDSAKRFGESILGGMKFAGRTIQRFFTGQ